MTTALDLFRGAGGWSVACQHLGIADDGVEIMREANETAALAGHQLAWTDVWEPVDITGFNGLIASPPCQTFSQAGKGAGRKALDDVLTLLPDVKHMSLLDLKGAARIFGDDRTALVLSPLWYALNMEPEWIALEQVPTVLPVWEACADELREAGYSVWTGNLQAEMYGVPQTRKRAFLIASLEKEVAPPEPTHSRYYPRNPTKLDEGVKKWISMSEALGFGLSQRPSPTVTGGGTETGGAEPIAKIQERWASREDWMQRRNSGPGAERPPRSVDEPAYTVRAQGSGSHPCGIELLPDWCYNRPSTTIVGTFKPEVVAAGYRTTVSRQNAPNSVRVTVQEAGVLQSFPANYPWQGAKGKQFLQAGNAVPPLLAEAVLSAVL